jgi:hypothetical protein
MQLHRDIGRIHDAGAELYVIGNGTPSFMAGFREQTGWQGPLYTDPSLEVYKAAELKRGVTKTLNPRAALGTVKAFIGGARQGLVQGDAWQQGGALVVATDGTVKWHHANEHPDDNATVDELVRALH